MKMRHVLGVMLVIAAYAACAQEDLEAAKQSLGKWLETERLVTKEEQDWRVGRDLIQERIDLIRREADSLKERIAQAKKDMGDAAVKAAELKAQNDVIKAGTKSLSDDIKKLELRTLAMLPRTPEPVRVRVAPLTQRIPANPAVTKLTLSERYQNVVGTLNELNKATRELSVSGEVRQLADGRKVEVTVFYIGLAQAYYVNEKSGVAGVGLLGPYGWTWEERNDLARPIARVLAIYRGESPAAYITLPVCVK